MKNISHEKLVEIIAEEVQNLLGAAGGKPPIACGTGVMRDPRRAGPGTGVGVQTPHAGSFGAPTANTPCTATKSECKACGWSVTRRPEDTRKIMELGAARISAKPQGDAIVPADIAPYIDHTLLKGETTREQLDELCQEAATHHFASVCVNPSNVRYSKAKLRGSNVKVVTVIGFPLGATSTAAKVCETRKALEDGADEIDMVINMGFLKSRDYDGVLDDIRRVVKAANPRPVKVILETASLDDNEKVIACALSKAAGAHFVKTSTGFGSGGATAADVTLMKAIVGEELEVKASGGIRSFEDAKAMVNAGATRIGASASVAIVTGKKTAGGSGY